jgi:polar amino acid transport system substrate-binding protein
MSGASLGQLQACRACRVLLTSFILSVIWVAPAVALAQAANLIEPQPAGSAQPGAQAQDADQDETGEPAADQGKAPVPHRARVLRVGVAGSEPFVVRTGQQVDGLSADVWRMLASAAKLRFQFVLVPTVEHGVDRVSKGDLDVLIGPISITASRAERVAFTHPYFRSSLAIATRADSSSWWDRVGPFLSKAFLVGVSSLLLVLLIVGTLLWATERKQNSAMFPLRPLKGIGNGIWMALVTMTTVGYGDRVPVTLAGRIVTGIWMVIAMLTVSSLTAGIATTLTLAQLDRGLIEHADQLAGRRVAVVKETVGVRFASSYRARVRTAGSVTQALQLLEQGKVEAVVHDRPILRYYIAQHDAQLYLSEGVSSSQGYGFAVAQDGNLAKPLTLALLKAREAGLLDQLATKWLGD